MPKKAKKQTQVKTKVKTQAKKVKKPVKESVDKPVEKLYCFACKHELVPMKDLPLLVCTNQECSRFGIAQVVFYKAKEIKK